jgi:hypothetical protein
MNMSISEFEPQWIQGADNLPPIITVINHNGPAPMTGQMPGIHSLKTT